MINENLYEDKPYIPSRDPREYNVVDRIRELENDHNKEYNPINDESVEYNDIPKILSEIETGVPGSIVRLGEDGLIDPKYLSPISGGTAIMSASTHLDFPPVGNENLLYIATEENEGKGYLYIWSSKSRCYERPDDDSSCRIIRKQHLSDFPSIGDEDFLYLSEDNNVMYFWSNKDSKFIPTNSESSTTLPDVLKINGGNAESIYE